MGASSNDGVAPVFRCETAQLVDDIWIDPVAIWCVMFYTNLGTILKRKRLVYSSSWSMSKIIVVTSFQWIKLWPNLSITVNLWAGAIWNTPCACSMESLCFQLLYLWYLSGFYYVYKRRAWFICTHCSIYVCLSVAVYPLLVQYWQWSDHRYSHFFWRWPIRAYLFHRYSAYSSSHLHGIE